MNITDYAVPEAPVDWRDIVRAIFARQAELMVKYKEIEQLPSPPLSLHTAGHQRILKDFAWRTVEELTESFEAWDKHPADAEIAKMHALEELADAVHFFIELLIFAGITAEQAIEVQPFFPPPYRNGYATPSTLRADYYWRPVYAIGLAMNFLRNKAWKTSHVPTDEARFREALLKAWTSVVYVWVCLEEDQTALYQFYFRKSEVNKFRQRSAY